MKLVDLCKGRYPVGLLYLDKELQHDAGVSQASETGADFLVSVESSESLIRLCEKYDLGIISTSNMSSFWWGGNGDNAGGYERQFPLSELDNVKCYPTSRSVWGDYIADEPNSKDFAHIDKVLRRYAERFPEKLPLVTLYPCYGQLPGNSDEEIMLQLGNSTYAEYIDQYVHEVNLPYVCFNYYPFTGAIASYIENLEIVANACRDASKDMWVIVQAGAWDSGSILDSYQLDWQVFMCLAYGAKALIFASYSKGWWDESSACVNLKGEKNKTYGYVKDISSVLHSPLGAELLEFRYVHTRVYGNVVSAARYAEQQPVTQNKVEMLPDWRTVRVTTDKAIVAGYYAKPKEDSYAIFVVNAHDPFSSAVTANVIIEADDQWKMTIWGSSQASSCISSTDACVTTELAIQSGHGVLLIFRKQKLL